MSSRPLSALREVLESIGPSRKRVDAALAAHLVSSGRAADASGDEAARNDRAEDSSRKVLETIEKATVAQQKKWNDRIDLLVAPHDVNLKKAEAELKALGDKPPAAAKKVLDESIAGLKLKIKDLTDKKVRLTHAVSAHGKGSEQEGRVLHGHRADEVVSSTSTKVGQDPSNTSGAFTSNQGMLGTFNEAFAQANLISQQGEQLRAEGDKTTPTLDQGRFATTIEGGEVLGYNIEAQGVAKQTAGRELLPDEIAQRKATLVRTEGLRNATVVMDPGYLLDDAGNLILEKGKPKRVGWNIQTAFAHGDAARTGSSYAKVGDVSGGTHQQQLSLETKTAKLNATREALSETREKIEEKFKSVKSAQERIASFDVMIAAYPQNVIEADQKIQAGKAEVEAERAEFAQLDLLEPDAKNFVEDLLTKSALGEGALIADAPAMAVLKGQLERLEKLCYEPAKPPAKKGATVKDACKAQQALLKKALTLFQSLNARAGLPKKLVGQKAQQTKDSEFVKKEADEIKKKPEVIALIDKEAADKAEVAALSTEALDLRRAMAGQDQAHEAIYGKPGQGAAGEGYNATLGEYTGDRPDKPAVLTGQDEGFDPLTAHHLYPWNKIKADLNKALRARSPSAMNALFQFAGFKPGPTFFDELAKDPATRDYKFASDVNVAAQQICWSPRNIFMGPLGEKRSDDPGEELDQTFEIDHKTKTLNTRIAHAMQKQGGVSARLDPAEVKSDLAQAIFDEKLAAYIKTKADKKPVTKSELDKLMDESLAEADPKVDAERVEREAAAKETEALLKERAKLEVERAGPLAEKIAAFKKVHADRLARRTPEQVREDLAAKAGDGKPVNFKAVDEEVEERRVLAVRLAVLEDQLAHAPKAYDPGDWQLGKDDKKSQKQEGT
ncbi:MAG TPA: hypothetical protein VGM81_17470 [Burkholderiaceae bacterium]|jgi:hypothetical protein